MSPILWAAAGGVVLLVLIILEIRRQERKYGRASGRGGDLTRAGMLELQALLEPDRKVEILKEERQDDRTGLSESTGDPPRGMPPG